jgi:hypothetical protein
MQVLTNKENKTPAVCNRQNLEFLEMRVRWSCSEADDYGVMVSSFLITLFLRRIMQDLWLCRLWLQRYLDQATFPMASNGKV